MKNLSVRKNKRNFSYPLIAILCLISLIYIFYKYPPTGSFNLVIFEFPVLPVFLLLICGFVYSLTTFFLIRKLQGAIFTVFVMFYIFLRVVGLTNIIFLIILIAILVIIELVMFNKIKLPKK